MTDSPPTITADARCEGASVPCEDACQERPVSLVPQERTGRLRLRLTETSGPTHMEAPPPHIERG